MARTATTLLALLAALVASGAGAAGAHAAATLKTDTRCYQETQEVVVSGSGFAPSSVVTISRDGTVLGSTSTDAGGAFRNKFDTPELPRDVRERLYAISATDAANTTAQTSYRATRIFASFRPRSGNPSTLKVRFSIHGFGLVQRRAPVYLHYVRPSGKPARTIRLGTATGVCGVIARTRERRLFAFEPSKGTWILQFDTRRRYERATSKRRTPWVRKPVQIFSRSR
ncbi:MAG: hypothetical protein KY463_11020 [Actinobacteria bacterium]|nr:hypothetical protein [Actinomycetota bacterium]